MFLSATLTAAAAGYAAIAYDQPGFGLTDNPSDYSLPIALASS